MYSFPASVVLVVDMILFLSFEGSQTRASKNLDFGFGKKVCYFVSAVADENIQLLCLSQNLSYFFYLLVLSLNDIINKCF